MHIKKIWIAIVFVLLLPSVVSAQENEDPVTVIATREYVLAGEVEFRVGTQMLYYNLESRAEDRVAFVTESGTVCAIHASTATDAQMNCAPILPHLNNTISWVNGHTLYIQHSAKNGELVWLWDTATGQLTELTVVSSPAPDGHYERGTFLLGLDLETGEGEGLLTSFVGYEDFYRWAAVSLDTEKSEIVFVDLGNGMWQHEMDFAGLPEKSEKILAYFDFAGNEETDYLVVHDWAEPEPQRFALPDLNGRRMVWFESEWIWGSYVITLESADYRTLTIVQVFPHDEVDDFPTRFRLQHELGGTTYGLTKHRQQDDCPFVTEIWSYANNAEPFAVHCGSVVEDFVIFNVE